MARDLPLASDPQFARRLLLPYDDLGIKSEHASDLVIPRDVDVNLSYMVAKGPDGYHLVQVDSSGKLLTSGSGGSGSSAVQIADPTSPSQQATVDLHGSLATGLVMPNGIPVDLGNGLPVKIVSGGGGVNAWAYQTLWASAAHNSGDFSSAFTVDLFKDFIFYLIVTAVGANSGTLYLQTTYDNGTTYVDTSIIQPQNFNANGTYVTQYVPGYPVTGGTFAPSGSYGWGLLGPKIRLHLTSNGALTFSVVLAYR